MDELLDAVVTLLCRGPARGETSPPQFGGLTKTIIANIAGSYGYVLALLGSIDDPGQ